MHVSLEHCRNHSMPRSNYLNVFLQLVGVVKSPVACPTVGDKPGDLFRLVQGVVVILFLLLHLCVVVLPFLIGCHDGAVPPAEEKRLIVDKWRIKAVLTHL